MNKSEKHFGFVRWLRGAVVAGLMASAGCIQLTDSQLDALLSTSAASNLLAKVETRLDEEIAKEEARASAVEADPSPEGGSPAAESDISTLFPGGVTWLGMNVSSWPVTTELAASVSGGKVRLPFDKTKVWPAVDGVNANPWVFIQKDGKTYAATWEWLRPGDPNKNVGDISGGLKRKELDSWAPASGEPVYFMVSGLCRSSTRNVSERSSISKVVWP